MRRLDHAHDVRFPEVELKRVREELGAAASALAELRLRVAELESAVEAQQQLAAARMAERTRWDPTSLPLPTVNLPSTL